MALQRCGASRSIVHWPRNARLRHSERSAPPDAVDYEGGNRTFLDFDTTRTKLDATTAREEAITGSAAERQSLTFLLVRRPTQ